MKKELHMVRFPVRKISFPLHDFLKLSVIQSVSYSVGTEGAFVGRQTKGRQADCTPPTGVEVKDE
jgi:hypothetical protein